MMDFSFLWAQMPLLMVGVKYTAITVVISACFALLIGVGWAVSRNSQLKILSLPATVVVDFFRITPLVVQVIWVYFALPVFVGKSIPALLAGIVALSLYEAAYFSEIIRAGLNAVSQGQKEASLSLGIGKLSTFRRTILPQAFTSMLPVIGSQFTLLIKNSTILSVIGVAELTFQAQRISALTLQPFVALTGALLIYVLLTYPVTVVFTRWYTIRQRRLVG